MKLPAIISAMVMVAITSLSSCSKSSDPAPAPSTTVVMPATNYTTYKGAYTYTDASGKVVADDNATATVTDKGSNNVEIRFSASGAPTVTFTVKKTAGGDYANVDSSQQKGISFTGNSLDVGVTSVNPIFVLGFSGTR